MDNITKKQAQRVKAIMEYHGKAYVLSYIRYFYVDACLDKLTKQQAQKIITGLSKNLPRKFISNIYLRDTFC